MKNLNFKSFLEVEFMSDVDETMSKLPKSHSKLIKKYKFHPEKDNTLKGDEEHVGEIDEKNKKIKVAAPWHYSREIVVLHELAHAVWKYKMSNELKSSWKELLKKNKKNDKAKQDLNQNDEEIFCMIYAQFYCKNKVSKFEYPKLLDFIKNEVPK